jgi:P-type conjugative transfer protein TrbJ
MSSIQRKRVQAIVLAPLMALSLVLPLAPARSIIVFDPSNYAQSVLQAARALQQITNQIQSLQNQATMIEGMIKNLDHLNFSSLSDMTATLGQVSRLMGAAHDISFRANETESQIRTLFPGSVQIFATDQNVQAATARLTAQRNALTQAMLVQSEITDDANRDAQTLTDLVTQSQAAHGTLQAQQAANQLLALTAKQQISLQAMLAAEARATAMESALRLQAQTDGQAATRRFLGSGHAYTPVP